MGRTMQPPEAHGQYAMKVQKSIASAGMKFLSVPGSESKVYHVHYNDLIPGIGDPIGTVRSIYERFGLPFSDEYKARLEIWLAEDKKRRAMKKFRPMPYSLADIGMNIFFKIKKWKFINKRIVFKKQTYLFRKFKVF